MAARPLGGIARHGNAMNPTLIQSLAAFDPTDSASLRAIHEALAQFAGGPIWEEKARAKFWRRVKGDDAGTITQLLVRAYLAHHRESCRRTARMSDESDPVRLEELMSDVLGEFRTSLNLHIMLLLGDAGECVEHCLDEVAQMLLDENQGIYFVACKMLAGSPCRRFVPADTILEALSRRGIRQRPFTLGEALIKASRHDQKLAETLVGAINGNKHLNSAVLSILAELPVDEQLKHAKACQVAERLRPWSGDDWSCEACAALGAIAEIGMVTPQAAAIIECALESGEWHIRAQAALTAGKLRINPTEVVPKLISLLGDTEGDRHTVQESAVEGLGQYGNAACEALEPLAALKANLLPNDEAADFLEEIETAIARIREN